MDDLDDFFAKKDKKKCKRNRFNTLNEIDKKLEARKIEMMNQENNDNEWKDFEERKKDFTGLKIQNKFHEEEEENIEISDEVIKIIDHHDLRLSPSTCPWKVPTQTQEKSADESENSQIVEAPQSSACNNVNKNAGAYIPPHLRKKSEFTLDRKKCIVVPGVELSDAMFPALQRTAPGDSTSVWVQKQWQEVKTKGTKKPNSQGTLHHLDNSDNVNDFPLVNKFRTLSEQAE